MCGRATKSTYISECLKHSASTEITKKYAFGHIIFDHISDQFCSVRSFFSSPLKPEPTFILFIYQHLFREKWKSFLQLRFSFRLMVGTWSENWMKVKINHKPKISNTTQVSAEPHTVTPFLQEAALLWLGRQTKLCKYAMPVTRTYLLIYSYANCGHMAPALLQHGWTKPSVCWQSSVFPWNKNPNPKNQELLIKSSLLNKGNTNKCFQTDHSSSNISFLCS